MKTHALSAVAIKSVKFSELPHGTYRGVWGGYEVVLNVDDVEYHLKTQNGVRGIDIPCTVYIAKDSVTASVE